MKKLLNKWIQSPLPSLIIAACVHVIFILVILLISRYSKIHGSTFILIISILMLIVLLLDVLLLMGYSQDKALFKSISLVFSCFLLLSGSLGGIYLYRVQNAIDGIFKPEETEQVEFSLVTFDGQEELDHQKLGFVGASEGFEQKVKETVQPLSRTLTRSSRLAY